jgi:flagella basal body P-ring formation protein FlgA
LLGERLRADLARTLPGTAVEVGGAASCRVLPATEVVAGPAIEAAARGELLRRLEGGDVELSLAGELPDVEVPCGERALELRAVVDSAARAGGSVSVPVRLMVDGALYRTVWTSWRVAVWEEACVPARAILAGETISLDMLEKRRVASGGEPALPAALCLGATAARELAPGQPLRESDLLRPLLVRRGDPLFLEVRRGGIHARIGAVADSDARAGERLRVTVLDTRRSLTATAVARDLAVIDL